MSRNSKNATRIMDARKMAEIHKNGGKGPAKTAPKHGKKKAWWQKFPSYRAYIKGAKAQKQAD